MTQLPLTAALCAVLVTVGVRAQDAEKGQEHPAKTSAPLSVGSAIPADLKLKDIDGKEFAFKDQLGKIVVVHFWSITCPWETVAEPKIQKLCADYKDKDVVFVAINANKGEIGSEPDAKAFEAKEEKDKPYQNLRKHVAGSDFNHRVLIDHSGDVARLLGAKTTPHCFVVDAKGALRYSGGLDNDGKSETVDADKQYVRVAIEALRAGKPVSQQTTKPYG